METKMKRRKFMGLVVGTVLVPKILCQGKENKPYNLIDDLVEEINKDKKERPTKKPEYYILCNYCGLGWLDAHGYIERKQHQSDCHEDYIWVYELSIPLIGRKRYCHKIDIILVMSEEEKDDITLYYVGSKNMNFYNSITKESGSLTFPDYIRVTTRYSSIDYTERGKKINSWK